MGEAARPDPEEGLHAPVLDEAQVPSPSWGRRLLTWAGRLLLGVAMLGIALIVGGIALVWPYVRDDLLLDRVVLAVALDWRDFGRDKAQARLEYELDHQRIGMQVTDEHCALTESGDGLRRVGCAWTAQVRVPLLEVRVPLSFASQATLGPDGLLR